MPRFPKRIAKELAHIQKKLERALDFGFLPLSTAFLGVEEVV